MTGQDTGRVRLDPPLAGDSTGPLLVWIVALTGYLAAIGGLVLVLLSDDLRVWNRSLGNSLTVQIPAEASAPRIETILALLRQTAGIRGVRLLEPAETAKLLEPWLGPAAAIATLPIPRLVDVQLEPDAAIDLSHYAQSDAGVMVRLGHRMWRWVRRRQRHQPWQHSQHQPADQLSHCGHDRHAVRLDMLRADVLPAQVVERLVQHLIRGAVERLAADHAERALAIDAAHDDREIDRRLLIDEHQYGLLYSIEGRRVMVTAVVSSKQDSDSTRRMLDRR